MNETQRTEQLNWLLKHIHVFEVKARPANSPGTLAPSAQSAGNQLVALRVEFQPATPDWFAVLDEAGETRAVFAVWRRYKYAYDIYVGRDEEQKRARCTDAQSAIRRIASLLHPGCSVRHHSTEPGST